MSETKVSVGVDVAKDTLEMHCNKTDERWTTSTTKTALRQMARKMLKIKPDIVVIEATGGWEKPVVRVLVKAGLPVAVLNPRRVRRFADAMGYLAKTDQIDAKVLSLFGEKMDPEVRPQPSDEEELLKEMVRRRQQLTEMLTQERNRLPQVPPNLKKNVKKHVEWLEKELKELTGQIESQLNITPACRDKAQVLRRTQGCGKVLSVALLGMLPELGRLNRQKIGALVGIAPFNCDSGKWRGKRRIFGGRKHLRNILYMATLAACRKNHVIRSYYQHLIAKGKLPKVAIVACMRKLLTYLNSEMRKHLALQEASAMA